MLHSQLQGQRLPLPAFPFWPPEPLARAALPLPLLADRIAFLTLRTSSPPDSDLLDFFDAGALSSFDKMARSRDFSFSAEISVGSNCNDAD